MSFVREVITLQAGQCSNFIGSHWLNLQESSFVYDEAASTDLNNDYFFREGKLPNNQECYIPRLLIIDAKGSLGSLPRTGTLYEPVSFDNPSSHALWSGKVEQFNQMPENKNEFLQALEREDSQYAKKDEDKDICSDDSLVAQQNEIEKVEFDLKNKVNFWSDFLRPHLHHKAIYLLDDFYHEDIGINSTKSHEEYKYGTSFQEGISAMMKESTEEEITDRIRLLAESCGSLQGFQLLCDGHDGMGGISAMVAQHVADDYSSKELFSFISTPTYNTYKESSDIAVYLTNLIQSYTEISKNSTLVLPLNLMNNICLPTSDVVRWPYVSYQSRCPYESSSIFASFLDTISVLWRTKSNAFSMNSVTTLLTPLQRKVVHGGLNFPIGIEERTSFHDWLKKNKSINVYPVGGGWQSNSSKISEICAIRGISDNILERDLPKKNKFSSAWHLYDYYLMKEDQQLKRTISRILSGTRDPLKTCSPFPQIFTDSVDYNGFLKRTSDNAASAVQSVSSFASIYQGKGIGKWLNNIYTTGNEINTAKLSKLSTGGLEHDVWKNTLQDFLSIVNCYDEDTDLNNYEDSD